MVEGSKFEQLCFILMQLQMELSERQECRVFYNYSKSIVGEQRVNMLRTLYMWW